MDDGLVLCADVFRPVAEGKYPVILSYGPYGKGVDFQEGYRVAWEIMATAHWSHWVSPGIKESS